MSASASSSDHSHPYAEASRSRTPSGHNSPHDDQDAANLLEDDPLGSGLQQQVSFKRRNKSLSSNGFSLPSLPKIFTSSRQSTPVQRPSSSRAEHRRNRSAFRSQDPVDPILAYLDGPGDGGADPGDAKDPSGVDWYVEGPGRRVGYDDLTAIDWIFEYAKERQRLRLLYAGASGALGQIKQIADASQIWIVLILTGLASGVVSAFIDVASDWLGDLKTGYCKNEGGDGKFYLHKNFCCWGYDELAQCADWHPWSGALGVTSKAGSYSVEYFFFVVLSVLFAACASILVKHHAIYAKHSGIPEIKTVLGGFVIRYFMGTWTLVIKSLGLLANEKFSQPLPLQAFLWLSELPSEECFSALRCVCLTKFNEMKADYFQTLSYYFPDKTMWQSFVCAMTGAVALHWFDPFRTNKLVMYQVTYHSGWHGFEMVPFAILGVLGGVYGGILIKLNLKVAERRRDSPLFNGPIREVVAASLLTALINFPIKFMRAQATELLYVLFAECRDIQDDQLGLCKAGKANTEVITLLIVSAVLGVLLAAVSFGLLIPAGILLPSMAIGALYGRAVGLIVRVMHMSHKNKFPFTACEPDIPCVTPGTYAIIGAASAIGGATRMTVSIVVIMFELTGALTYVLPIMIAVMISKWVGDAISPRGIYEAWIHFNGYPFLDNRDDDGSSVPDVPASQVMTRIEDLVVITATGHTIQSLRSLLSQHSFRGFPIIDNPRDALLLGYISRTELAYALSVAISSPRNLSVDAEAYFAHQPLSDPTTSLDLRPWMDQTPITLNAKASLQLTVNMFSKLGLRYVVFTEKGCLRGLLTKKDVWFVLNGEGEIRDAGGVVGRSALREEGFSVEERGLLGDDDEDDEDGHRRDGLG
ncbi:chloride channel [Neofusicoccum ribis]|uniref:Chloride channel protein n=1 Tax=Neofusicoccum ribis TaxID=45134 RepID=A0ABR3SEW4_9PEZI